MVHATVKQLVKKLKKLIRILLVSEYRRALISHQVAAGVEHEPILRNLGEVALVVDIGANRGQFALTARRVFGTSRILSFEPLPDPASVFSRVFADDKRVSLVQSAIGVESQTQDMHVSAHDDSSSLLSISELQNELFPGTSSVGTTTVSVAPLDLSLSAETVVQPALLKLDVQGYELEALRGCSTVLNEFNWIYCECSFLELYEGQALVPEVIDWLATKSFRVVGIYNVQYDKSGRSIQADFLFERTSNLDLE